MKNRIKEQLSVFADRVGTEMVRANQMRVYLSGLAYVLVSALRRIGFRGTKTARATPIRLRVLKIGAQVKIMARRVRVHLAQSFPLQALIRRFAEQLR